MKYKFKLLKGALLSGLFCLFASAFSSTYAGATVGTLNFADIAGSDTGTNVQITGTLNDLVNNKYVYQIDGAAPTTPFNTGIDVPVGGDIAGITNGQTVYIVEIVTATGTIVDSNSARSSCSDVSARG